MKKDYQDTYLVQHNDLFLQKAFQLNMPFKTLLVLENWGMFLIYTLLQIFLKN